MARFRTHYDNLNVSRNAPLNVIKAAYKVLCQNYHPDKYSGGSEEALRIMKIINGAYVILSDPHKRAEYDQWIDKQERELAVGEAQRMMKIITKTYVPPPVIAGKNDFWTTINSFWKKICSGDLISTQTSKKLSWIFGLIAVVFILFTATILYMSELKTSTVATALANRDIEETLEKVKQLVKQGKEELPLYLPLAKRGNADAQFYVGLIYANGQGVTKDDKQAVKWFAKAAEQGHSEAQTQLGFMYATGRGVEQNYNLAAYWSYKAADQGNVIAQYYLGLMYAKGQGMMQDNSLAVSWFSKAAAQGDARAQYNLGLMYTNGVGVAKDNKQAAVLFREAAKQGLEEAIAALKLLDQ